MLQQEKWYLGLSTVCSMHTGLENTWGGREPASCTRTYGKHIMDCCCERFLFDCFITSANASEDVHRGVENWWQNRQENTHTLKTQVFSLASRLALLMQMTKTTHTHPSRLARSMQQIKNTRTYTNHLQQQLQNAALTAPRPYLSPPSAVLSSPEQNSKAPKRMAALGAAK